MIPSLAQLKNEIETGELAVECAPYWTKVFDDQATHSPEWWAQKQHLVQHRQGMLMSDAANDINTILRDTTRRTKPNNIVSKGTFSSAIAPLCSIIAGLPEVEFKSWQLVLMLATAGSDESINLGRPQIIGLFTQAVNANLITQEQATAILNLGGTVPCSRYEELGWEGVTNEMIQEAKKVN